MDEKSLDSIASQKYSYFDMVKNPLHNKGPFLQIF